MAKVKHWYGLLSAYTAIGTKDTGTLYNVTDEQAIYLGTICIVRSGNTLNTTSTAQTKTGTLTISGLLTANGGFNATTGAFSSTINSKGGATSWGNFVGSTFAGLNVITGNSTTATWLLAGISGGVFRGGLQLLDAGYSMRLYLNPAAGATYFDFSNTTFDLVSKAFIGATTGAFSSNVTIGGTLGVTGASTLNNSLALNLGLNTLTRSATAVGSISFASYNSIGYIPSIVSKSDNNAALYYVGMTADANIAGSDVIFGVRRTDDVDFGSGYWSGKVAFSFRRYATTLFDIYRDGASKFYGSLTAPSLMVDGLLRLQNVFNGYGDSANPFYSTFISAGSDTVKTGIQWGNEANATSGSWIRFLVNSPFGANTPVYPLSIGHTVCAFTTKLTVAGTLVVTGSITASSFYEA